MAPARRLVASTLECPVWGISYRPTSLSRLKLWTPPLSILLLKERDESSFTLATHLLALEVIRTPILSMCL